MTSSVYDEESNIPQDYPDLMEVLGINEDNNLDQGDLGLIEFDDIPSMTDPVDEPKLQYNIPEVTYNHAPFNSLNVHSNYPHPTATQNYQLPFYNYTNSPSQSIIAEYSESGFGDGSSVTTPSSYPASSTPGLLSPASDYSSPSPQSTTSRSSSLTSGRYDEVEKPIAIRIPEGAKHKYRHAKEMKIGHGGLKGEITLPLDYKSQNYRLILSVLPASNSKQRIHPCMLHVTVMNQNSKQKRAKYRTKLESPKDWRVILDVEQGKVYYIPNYGPPERFPIDCLRDGRLILGGNNLQVN